MDQARVRTPCCSARTDTLLPVGWRSRSIPPAGEFYGCSPKAVVPFPPPTPSSRFLKRFLYLAMSSDSTAAKWRKLLHYPEQGYSSTRSAGLPIEHKIRGILWTAALPQVFVQRKNSKAAAQPSCHSGGEDAPAPTGRRVS